MSATCGSQSQFCPIRVGPPRPGAGATANALHSPGLPGRAVAAVMLAACRALAAYITSVRTLIASTSRKSSPAPAARPRISAR